MRHLETPPKTIDRTDGKGSKGKGGVFSTSTSATSLSSLAASLNTPKIENKEQKASTQSSKDKERRLSQNVRAPSPLDKLRRLSHTSSVPTPKSATSPPHQNNGKNVSPMPAPNSAKRPQKKSFFDRLKENVHIDGFGGHKEQEPPELTLERVESDMMVLDGSRIHATEDDDDDDKEEIKERTAIIQSVSTPSKERLRKEDFQSSTYSGDGDDPTRQDSVASYTEITN